MSLKRAGYLLLPIVGLLIVACSSKLKDEYDFRPYIVAWMIDNCGANKKYNCTGRDDWAGGGFDGEDYVYGLYYTVESKKRIVWVKVAAKRPYERTVVHEEEVPEEK